MSYHWSSQKRLVGFQAFFNRVLAHLLHSVSPSRFFVVFYVGDGRGGFELHKSDSSIHPDHLLNTTIYVRRAQQIVR